MLQCVQTSGECPTSGRIALTPPAFRMHTELHRLPLTAATSGQPRLPGLSFDLSPSGSQERNGAVANDRETEAMTPSVMQEHKPSVPSVMQSEARRLARRYGAPMAKTTERRGAALRRTSGTADQPADRRLHLAGADAANDAALGNSAELEEDSLRVARSFATAIALGTVLWVAVGALVWLGLR
jgi:hypothetical protein